jgi:hypothetical protein
VRVAEVVSEPLDKNLAITRWQRWRHATDDRALHADDPTHGLEVRRRPQPLQLRKRRRVSGRSTSCRGGCSPICRITDQRPKQLRAIFA